MRFLRLLGWRLLFFADRPLTLMLMVILGLILMLTPILILILMHILIVMLILGLITDTDTNTNTDPFSPKSLYHREGGLIGMYIRVRGTPYGYIFFGRMGWEIDGRSYSHRGRHPLPLNASQNKEIHTNVNNILENKQKHMFCSKASANGHLPQCH